MAAIRDVLELDVADALRQVNRLREQIEKPVDVTVDVDTQGFADLDRRLDDIEQSAGDVADEVKRIAAEAGKADADFTQLAQALDVSEDEAQALTAQILRASSAASRTEAAARDIADELGLSEKEARDLARSLNKAADQADDIDDATGRATKGIGGMSSALKGFISIAAAGLVARQIVSFGAATVTAASDMAESVGKAEVVFGEFAEQIFDFTEDAPRALRLSTQEAVEMAGTFGNLFLALGLSQEAAAGLAPEIVQLGADLGSFNNIEVGEVLEKLRAGLVGEAEPLRTLGVNLTAATTKAKAFELGLADANGVVDAAGLVQARWAQILEQTTTAQGDAAKTADLFAGQTATLAAEFENLKAEIGEELIPLLLEMIPILQDLIVELGPNLVNAAEDALLALGLIVGIFDPAVAEATEMVLIFRAVDESMGDGFGNMTKFRTAIEELAKAGILNNDTFEKARKRFDVDLPDAIFGTRIAVDHLTDSFDDSKFVIGDYGNAEDILREQTEFLTRKQQELRGELDDVTSSARSAETITEELAEKTKLLGDRTANLVVDVEELVDVQHDLRDALKDSEQAQRDYLSALIASTDPLFRAVDAWSRYQEAIVSANEDGVVDANEQLDILKARLEAIDAFTTLGDGIEEGITAISDGANVAREDVDELFRELGVFDGSVFSADVLLNVIGSAPQFIPEGASLIGAGATTTGPAPFSETRENPTVTIINPTTQDLDTDATRAAQIVGAIGGMVK